MKLIRLIRGITFVTCMVVALAVHSQTTLNPNPNLNPNLNLPPPPSTNHPPGIGYKTVAPGVTLHQTSPVLYFRGILGMSDAERERALAGKPAESRKLLLAKVQEYTNLPPEIREARLRQTQLLWELTSLTNLPSADRPAFIKEVAPEDRPLLEDYTRWLALSPAGQKDFLDKLSKERRQALAQWESVPETERQQRSDQFRQFCDLDPAQQQKALNSFSDAERRTMEAALKTFAGLPEAQRKFCIQSFQKFAVMDPAERDEFLNNAARWEAMTPDERSLWRDLVQKSPVSPPMPPMPPMPPLPAGYHTVVYPPLPPGMILTPPMPPMPPMPPLPAGYHTVVYPPLPPGMILTPPMPPMPPGMKSNVVPSSSSNVAAAKTP